MAQTDVGHRHATTRPLAWLLLLPLVGAAVFGGDAFGVRDRVFPAPTTLSSTSLNNAAGQAVSGRNALPAEPYWVSLPQLSGAGSAARTISIAADALQWKADWTCARGSISIEARSPDAPEQSIAHSAPCGSAGEGFGVGSGRVTLTVSASSDWTLSVQQQLDRPQHSPPLTGMTPGSVVAAGSFYGIDQQGQGTARIYRMPDGSYALRLENFYVTPNTDFVIRLSALPHPSSTPEFLAGSYADVAPLPVTAGSFNFAIPAAVDPHAYHSVVIWCERLTSAYAAASLS